MLVLQELDSLRRQKVALALLMPVELEGHVQVRARTEARPSLAADPRHIALQDGKAVAFLSSKKSFTPSPEDRVPDELRSVSWGYLKWLIVATGARGAGHGAAALSAFEGIAVAWGVEAIGLRLDGTPPVEPRRDWFSRQGFTMTGSSNRFAFKVLSH